MSRIAIQTDQAPAAIGTYSQAIRSGHLLFVSGQIPLDPSSMELVGPGIHEQIRQTLDNLSAVAEAGGARLTDAVKVTVYLTDLADFAAVNEVMANYFEQPYPARAAIGVSALPRGAAVEIDAILSIQD